MAILPLLLPAVAVAAVAAAAAVVVAAALLLLAHLAANWASVPSAVAVAAGVWLADYAAAV